MGIFDNLFSKPEPVIINVDGLIMKIHNRKEALFQAEGFFKIAHDCAHLVNTTKNPEVFFFRYDLLIKKMTHLSQLEKFNIFSNPLPSQELNEILGKKELTINDFIDRYYDSICDKLISYKTEKAKEKKINEFYNTLIKYGNKMNDNNIKKFTELYYKLKELNKIKR